MGKRLKVLLTGAILALLLVGLLPTAVMAETVPMSASGTIGYISGTVGFPAGGSGMYIVQSRTVSGAFISGDLNSSYSMTYKGSIDLNTQAGNINGILSTGSYVFSIAGKSYPVTWTQTPEGYYIGKSYASGTWWFDGGNGTFTCDFSFVPTMDGHIDYILPGSTFTLTGKWNAKNQ